MAFIGEDQKLGWDFLQLKRRKKLQALVIGHAEIELAMDHQRGRMKLLDEIAGRPFGVNFRFLPGRPAELPKREP